MMILGHETQDWIDIYKLFFTEKGRNPQNLFELGEFWDNIKPRTPNSCIAITARLIEARNYITDSTTIFDMLTRFATAVGISER